MTKQGSSQKWLEAGLELFSKEGPEGIHVEKLARTMGLNKSGFYHYFGDREGFLTSLMEYHYKQATLFNDEAKKLKQFYPGYLDLLYKHRISVMVQMQLRRNMNDPIFNEAFLRVAKRNDKVLIPLWSDYLNINGNPELAYELWDILRDIFFIRINSTNFTKELLYSIVFEFAHVLDVLRKYVARNGIESIEAK